MRRLRVAILMGGRSSEREVSLWSGNRVARALDPAKYEVIPIDCALREALLSLAREPIDLAFIALHGRYGEDGKIQGMLEMLGIPYTGTGVLGSALAMHKAMAKKILRTEGVPTPPFVTLQGAEEIERFLLCFEEERRLSSAVGRWSLTVDCPTADRFDLPAVVKPNEEGSTIGVTIVREPEQMAQAVRAAACHDSCVLIEQFVAGTEITAAVIGNRQLKVLPLVEIVPQGGFYDYERKYTPGATEEIVPARISEVAAERARDLALRAHRALQCRGLSRTDLIVDGDEVTVLEVNTIPGLTGTSLVPRAAEAAGISFEQLVECLIDLALEEAGHVQPAVVA